MGNTKHFYFEGCPVKEITKELINHYFSASYTAFEIDSKGYLGDTSVNEKDYIFIVGCFHTYASRAVSNVKKFADDNFESLIIHWWDNDNCEFNYREYEYGEEVNYVSKQLMSPADVT